MKYKYILILSLFCSSFIMNAQKDSLQLGDRYSEDQIYASISYAQFFKQPQSISRSTFSYAFSVGFIKDFSLRKKGDIAIALGVGYGFDFFNHKLKVEEINMNSVFNTVGSSSNVFRSHNLEFPIELRWRTSNANKYNFWRIYTGIKFLYNLSNTFQVEENGLNNNYSNISAYNDFQYGLTLSAGYDAFNINIFYSLTPIFENASLNGESINTSILKFGFVFYFL